MSDNIENNLEEPLTSTEFEEEENLSDTLEVTEETIHSKRVDNFIDTKPLLGSIREIDIE